MSTSTQRVMGPTSPTNIRERGPTPRHKLNRRNRRRGYETLDRKSRAGARGGPPS
jgi:hypothetical protein